MPRGQDYLFYARHKRFLFDEGTTGEKKSSSENLVVQAPQRRGDAESSLWERSAVRISGIAFDDEHSISRILFTLPMRAEMQRSHGSALFLFASQRLCGWLLLLWTFFT